MSHYIKYVLLFCLLNISQALNGWAAMNNRVLHKQSVLHSGLSVLSSPSFLTTSSSSRKSGLSAYEIALICILAVAIIAIGLFFIYYKYRQKKPSPSFSTSHSSATKSSISSSKNVRGDWRRVPHMYEQKKVYYYVNLKTHETQWEPPEEFKNSIRSVASLKSDTAYLLADNQSTTAPNLNVSVSAVSGFGSADGPVRTSPPKDLL